jgi:hypothetical protein
MGQTILSTCFPLLRPSHNAASIYRYQYSTGTGTVPVQYRYRIPYVNTIIGVFNLSFITSTLRTFTQTSFDCFPTSSFILLPVSRQISQWQVTTFTPAPVPLRHRLTTTSEHLPPGRLLLVPKYHSYPPNFNHLTTR